MAWVMSQVRYIQKTGWNDFHKYKYVTEGDLVANIRPLLAKVGVVIVPSVVEEQRWPDAIQERSGSSSLSTITVEFTITDGRDSMTFRMPGYGADKGDKGIYKAITGAQKYALMKLFLVETGDDPERESPGGAEETSQGGAVNISSSKEDGIEKGGRATKATRYQLQRITATMREKGMTRTDLLTTITDLFGVELQMPPNDDEAQQMILQFLRDLDAEDAGMLVAAVDAWSETGDESA